MYESCLSTHLTKGCAFLLHYCYIYLMQICGVFTRHDCVRCWHYLVVFLPDHVYLQFCVTSIWEDSVVVLRQNVEFFSSMLANDARRTNE